MDRHLLVCAACIYYSINSAVSHPLFWYRNPDMGDGHLCQFYIRQGIPNHSWVKCSPLITEVSANLPFPFFSSLFALIALNICKNFKGFQECIVSYSMLVACIYEHIFIIHKHLYFSFSNIEKKFFQMLDVYMVIYS